MTRRKELMPAKITEKTEKVFVIFPKEVIKNEK